MFMLDSKRKECESHTCRFHGMNGYFKCNICDIEITPKEFYESLEQGRKNRFKKERKKIN